MLITLESSLVNRKCVRGLVVLMLTLKHNKRAKKKCVNEIHFLINTPKSTVAAIKNCI